MTLDDAISRLTRIVKSDLAGQPGMTLDASLSVTRRDSALEPVFSTPCSEPLLGRCSEQQSRRGTSRMPPVRWGISPQTKARSWLSARCEMNGDCATRLQFSNVETLRVLNSNDMSRVDGGGILCR